MLSKLLRLLFLAIAVAAVPAPASENPPTPDEFAGFPIGSDGNLVRWEKIVEYFRLLDGASDRILLEELGPTTAGNPFVLATISAPENLARLEEIRAAQRRMALQPDEISAAEERKLAWNSPAVVLITCNIHATEIGSSQMVLELGHQIATGDSPLLRHILDNVVFLLVPSFNPDGQIIVTDWNNRVRGTEHVWARLPELYHPYVGHDNNRDAFMMTQVESRYVNKILFQDWFPQAYLDQHQQGNAGMRVFVPPFRNPINPNVDPAIWALAGQFGFAMYQKLHEEGFTGVGYDQKYTAWWQGGFLRGAWFHNMVGILTEVASANLASPVFQEEAQLGEPSLNAKAYSEWLDERLEDPAAPLPPPSDVMPRYDYPRPWLGGKWTLRDIIDAELAITYALLEQAANDRVNLVRTQIRLGREAIAAGQAGDPWAYVFPAGQHDPGAVYELLEALHYAGIEVEQAEEPFEAGDATYPAGSFLIPMAQPFRSYAKDLLEPQNHPDPDEMPVGSMGDQPYDLTTWSLPLQMGVEAVAIEQEFTVKSKSLDSIPQPQGKIKQANRASAGYVLDPAPNRVEQAVNRLLAAEAKVARIEKEFAGFAPGAYWVREAPEGFLEATVEELGLHAVGIETMPREHREVRVARTGLYRPWTASMDEGWTRWLLEQYEFPFETVRDEDLRAGALVDRFDAILLPGDRGEEDLLEGADSEATPEEYRGGLGEEGRRALAEFVAQGGALATWGDATEFALETFALPLRNVLKDLPREDFSCPGSFLRLQVDPNRALAYGMQDDAIAVFKNNAAFEQAPGFSYTGLEVVARYPSSDILASGWIRREEHLANRIAAAEVRYKEGRVVLIGFRPQFRAQPHTSFQLVFNAIRLAGSGM